MRRTLSFPEQESSVSVSVGVGDGQAWVHLHSGRYEMVLDVWPQVTAGELCYRPEPMSFGQQACEQPWSRAVATIPIDNRKHLHLRTGSLRPPGFGMPSVLSSAQLLEVEITAPVDRQVAARPAQVCGWTAWS